MSCPAEPVGGEDHPDAGPESAGHLPLVRGGQERAGESRGETAPPFVFQLAISQATSPSVWVLIRPVPDPGQEFWAICFISLMDHFVFILESLSYLRLFHTKPFQSFLSRISPQISEEWEDFKCLFKVCRKKKRCIKQSECTVCSC